MSVEPPQATPRQETFHDAVWADPDLTAEQKAKHLYDSCRHLWWLYEAAEANAMNGANRAQLAAVYGLVTTLETVARTQPERPEAILSQAVATLLRDTLDRASAPGGQG